MKKYVMWVFALLVVGVLSSGCATITKGGHQSVGISSSPIGSEFSVGGMRYTTPAVVKLKRNQNHIVVFEKPGYKSASGTIVSNFSPAIFGNFLFIHPALWLVGFGTDITTGASYNLMPTNVHVTLTPIGPAATTE